MPIIHPAAPPRRQAGGATLKVVGAIALVAVAFVGYRAYEFYQAKVAPVVDVVSQVAAGAATTLERLHPMEVSRDPAVVGEVLQASFGVTAPRGYTGSFVLNVATLGVPQMRLLALLPEGVDPRTVFEAGDDELRFDPGASTMFMAAEFNGAEPDEMRDAIAKIAAGDGDSAPMQPVFIDVGGRKVAALRGDTQRQGRTQSMVFTFLDEGRVLFATGPREGFDESALTALLGALVASHPANTLLYEHPKPPQVLPPSADPCGIPGLGNDFDVVMISIYGGSKPLEVAIDQSGHRVGEESVIVGRTPKPVVLLLAGYDPTVWHIGRTADARIAGVLAQGYHRQVVTGLPKATRITQYSTEDGPNACRHFRADKFGPDASVRNRVRELFGRRITTFQSAKPGAHFTVGEVVGDVQYSQDVTLKDVALADDVMPGGQRGVDRLVQQQALRLATPSEIDQWMAGAARRAGKTLEQYRKDFGRYLESTGTYVVLKPVELPSGLYGANSRVFLIPTGTPMPTGDRGHNAFLRMDGFACEGPMCR